MDAVNKLLYAFLTLIVGVVLLGTISTSVLNVNSGTQVINETQAIDAALAGGALSITYPFNVTHAPALGTWQRDTADGCPLTGIAIKNATNVALTRDTHYTFWPINGSWTLKGTTVNSTHFWANNNSYVSYTYCGDDYMNLTWGRSVLSVAVGMFALGLLAVSVGLFYAVARDYGLI
jgi:hypothetical protein